MLLAACGIAFCAEGGGISGVVVGRAGTAASARVSVWLPATGFRRDLTADASGRFTLTGLRSGAYVVTATSETDGSSGHANATVREGQTVELTLSLGASAVAGSDLPLGARSPLDLVRNQSQITPGEQGGNIEGWGPYGLRGNLSFNSYGHRGQSNNFLLDGADNNNAWVRGPAAAPPLEAVGAVTVLAGYMPAAFGRAAGAVVNLETRSGSNQFHGSAYGYRQDGFLASRGFFDRAEKPGLIRNQFGAAAGGPILRNKWFLFADAEGVRGREGVTITSTVPTSAQKAGNFADGAVIYDPLSIHQVATDFFERTPFPENRIPPALLSAPSRALASFYPDPTLPGAADNYSLAADSVRNSDRFDLRSDYVLPGGGLFLRVSGGRANGRSPGALPVPARFALPEGGYAGSDAAQNADAVNSRENWQNGAISYTRTLGRLVNELRAGVNVSDLHAYAADAGFNASAALGIPGLGSDGMPYFSALGFASLGAAGAAPFAIREASYEVEDSVSWKAGRHSWRFGFQAIRRHADGDASEWSSRGAFFFTPDYTSQPGVAGTGDSFASLLIGYPSEVRRDVQFAPFRLRAWEWAGYAQDSFRLGRRLTIDAGVRYSLFPPVTEAADRMVNFNADRTAPALDIFAGNGANRYAGVGYNKRALAPRVGFALLLAEDGTAVLRGSFSQAWDTGSYIASGRLARNAPYASRLDIINGTFQVGQSLAAGLPAAAPAMLLDAAALNAARGSIYAVQPADYTPYSDQWSLALGLRPRPGLTVEIEGMGSMGMHLYNISDANQPYPAPTPYSHPRYPFEPYHSRVEYLSFAGGSTYYGGTVRAAANLISGLRFQLGYTYAKSLDDATAPGTDQQSRPAMPQYVYSPRSSRSPSPFDIAQRLVWTASYDLPVKGRHDSRVAALTANWRAYAVVTLQTGFPFTPELAVNSLNNGGIQLPNRIGDGSLPAGQRSYLGWFNTSLNPGDPNRAFEIPGLYQYGNSGFDIVRGPGLANVDTALARDFQLSDRSRVQMRVDAFNLLNRTNLGLPNRILGVESSGVISHTVTPARRLQLAARLEW